MDGRILLLERTGHFQLDQMMKSIRIYSFMMNRFRLMERILSEVRRSEMATGQRQSAILVMDLDGLQFHAGLVAFISGPYRIMWGTLIEQYPSLLSAIVVLNCPASISLIWTACSSFIGESYRQRVHLLGRDWRNKLPADILPLEAMPEGEEYGGSRRECPTIREPQGCVIPPLDLTNCELAELETLNISAGQFLVRTYFLCGGERLQFVLGHEQEMTLNIWHSKTKRIVKPEEMLNEEGDNGDEDGQQNGRRDPERNVENGKEEEEEIEEAFAGCERPGMPNLDSWQWIVPKSGFYHLAFGNEKAWILPVFLKFQLFQVHRNGHRVKMQPIPMDGEEKEGEGGGEDENKRGRRQA